MHPDLSLVRELQEVDHRIGELTREINELPKHIAVIESRLESHRRRLEADRAALAANQKERRGLEDDVKQHEQKITRLRGQMSEAKTNDVYRAFQHEIDFEQEAIRKVEDQILERMGEAEALDQNVKTAEAELKKEAAEVEKEKKTAEQRTAVDRRELAVAQDKRSGLARDITRPTLAIYERVRGRRGGVAVAALSKGRCMACNVILRLSYSQLIRTTDEIYVCEACGRILYYLPPEEAPSETPAEEPAKEMADCTAQTADPLPSPN
jgi:predicted  nucleic acid-binding Zn-ribbon protein